jgi:hypothetical protein
MNRNEKCRWAVQDELNDTYCVCDTSEYCSDFVGGDDSVCDDCSEYYYEFDDCNKIKDEATQGKENNNDY